jgi:smad nuclear-interacting protein 1
MDSERRSRRSPSPRRRSPPRRDDRDRSRSRSPPRRRDGDDIADRRLGLVAAAAPPPPPPPEGTVCQARVARIQDFGAFVELEGGGRYSALVHISQLAPRRVETVGEVVSIGDQVWVKLLPESKPGKLSASMKLVDQATGEAVDPGGTSGGGGGGGGGRRRIEPEEDVSKMTWGLQPLDRDDEDADAAAAAPAAPKLQPNYATTGKLAEETNKVNGVVLKWSEPADAAKPTKKWRMYVFKGKESLEPYHLHRQSGFLLGRERRVCDIPLDHPSCSSQHAALQFRMTEKREVVASGESRITRLVRPYVMDLGSTNGTFINGRKIEAERYVELLEKDVLRFGYSSREYVLLHAESGEG